MSGCKMRKMQPYRGCEPWFRNMIVSTRVYGRENLSVLVQFLNIFKCLFLFLQVGQGTYSSVFQAREVETGKMFALKKVRLDTLQPECIRFMAREIIILRTLDHPNIMKLEGIVTSQLSNSIYLVFEYMEHDLAGLISNPDIKFTDSQVRQHFL